jgi:hypothetical protein
MVKTMIDALFQLLAILTFVAAIGATAYFLYRAKKW